MALKLKVDKKEVEGKTFYFLEIGRKSHGRPDFILWVSHKLIKKEEDREYVEFPVPNSRIFVTEKGTRILKPYAGWNTYYFCWPSGYRGTSEVKVLQKVPESESEMYEFVKYASPQGSLGISHGALLCTPATKVVWGWKASGRLYGNAPKGITIIYSDGREETIENIESLEELSELNE
jgi:YHS domain-containing protein